MGNALKEQGKLEEAIENYTKALSIKPDYAKAYNNMGNALKEQGRLEEAIENYTKALSIKPDYVEAIVNASSLVVGKVGYGTLSECCATSTPLLGCYRDNFKESDVLRNFAINNLTHSEISIDDFQSMKWTNKILKVLQEAKTGNRKIHSNGANLAANYIRSFIN